MTCIVGVKEGGRIFIGGDSAASSPPSTEIYTVAGPKVFAADDYLVGYTISFRAGQVAQHEVEWPAPPPGCAGRDLERFLVREVVPRLRRALREAGALKIAEEIEQGAHFMIGVRGEIFSLGVDFSAVSNVEPYLAIGSGRHHAYGALHALRGLPLEPEERIRRALAAAAAYTYNVRPPFLVLAAPPQ